MRVYNLENYDILVPLAEVAEWQTRTTQNRVSKGVRVQVPPSAHNIQALSLLDKSPIWVYST